MRGLGYRIEVSDEVASLHREALVVDLHNDLLTKPLHGRYHLGRRHSPATFYNPLRLDIDLPRLQAGGVDALGCLLFAGFRSFARRRFWAQLPVFQAQLARFPDALVQARRPADLWMAKRAGKIALFLGVEGAYLVQGSEEDLDRLAEAGVVFFGPLWMRSNALGGSSNDSGANEGLTPAGRAFIGALNRRRILVDVSHASDRTVADLLEVSETPPFSSHSGCRAVHPNRRNLPDELLRGIASRGGIIGIIFASHYLGGALTATIETLADHLCHAIEVAGIDHVALGSDFDGFVPLPRGLRDVADLPRVTEVLWRRGLRHEALGKLLGENVVRYWERALPP